MICYSFNIIQNKMKKNSKILNVLLCCVLIVLAVFLYSIVIPVTRDYNLSLFVNEESTVKRKLLYNLFVIGIAFLIVIAIIFMQRRLSWQKLKIKIDKINTYINEKKRRKVYVFIVYGILFCLLSYYCSKRFSEGLWGSDLGQVYHIALYKYKGIPVPANSVAYIERYPNNIAVIWYEIIIFNIFQSPKIENIYIVNTIIELGLLLLVANQIYVQTKNIFRAFIPLVILFLFTPLFAYLSFTYTDNLGVFGTLFLYYIVQQKMWKKNILFIFLGFPMGVFLCMRANVIVCMVALVIVSIYSLGNFWQNLKTKWHKNKFISISLFLIISMLTMSGVLSFMADGLQFDIKRNAFPATHWLNMGQDDGTLGSYSHWDALKTQELLDNEGPSSASHYNLQSTIERIKKRKKSENWYFFTNKMSHEWSNGDFSIVKNIVVFNGITSVKYKALAQSKKTSVMKLHLDIFCRVIYLLATFQVIYYLFSKKRMSPEFLFVILSFVGTIIFYMFWESAERYGFVVLPILIIGVVYEQLTLFKKVPLHVSEDKDKEKDKLNKNEL